MSNPFGFEIDLKVY